MWADRLAESATRQPIRMGVFRGAIHDGLVTTRRSLIQIIRSREILVFSMIQPVVFILLFAYVFGGAITVPGVDYKVCLMADIFVQTIAFNGAATGVGMAEDMSKKIIDHVRSLPIVKSAVLAGRTTGDLIRGMFTSLVMVIAGFVFGWRIQDGVLRAFGGFLLVLGFGFAMSWIGAWIGLIVPSPEVANTAGFIWLFPVTFLSNAFVPLHGLTPWRLTVVSWNPVSYVAAACR